MVILTSILGCTPTQTTKALSIFSHVGELQTSFMRCRETWFKLLRSLGDLGRSSKALKTDYESTLIVHFSTQKSNLSSTSGTNLHSCFINSTFQLIFNPVSWKRMKIMTHYLVSASAPSPHARPLVSLLARIDLFRSLDFFS